MYMDDYEDILNMSKKHIGLEFNYKSKPPASQHDFRSFRYCLPHMRQVDVR